MYSASKSSEVKSTPTPLSLSPESISQQSCVELSIKEHVIESISQQSCVELSIKEHVIESISQQSCVEL